MNLRFGGTSWAFVSMIHQCTSPPSFSLYLSPAFVIAHRLPIAKGFNFFHFSQHHASSLPCLSPCLRNQTQVCHCWGSNRGNPRAQLQKEPLKTTLSIRFWQLSLLPMLGEGEKSQHLPSHLPIFPLPRYFTELASSLSALNVLQLKSQTPLSTNAPFPCPYQHTFLQGRE